MFGCVLRRLIGGAVIVALSMGSPVPAAAFPRDDAPFPCWSGWRKVRIEFFGDNWDSQRKTAVLAGFNEWEVTRDYDGTPVVDVGTGITGETTYQVTRVASPGGANANAAVACNAPPHPGGVIELNTNLTVDTIGDSARQEMGHVFGLHHTGKGDSFDGRRPSMAVCVGGRGYARDDAASLLYRASHVSLRGLHANPGFEEGLSHWGVFGGAAGVYSTGSQAGSNHLRWTPGNTDHHLRQTINFAAGSGSVIRSRVNLRRYVGDIRGGVVGVFVDARKVEYPLPEPDSCEAKDDFYWTGKNQNIRTAFTFVRKIQSGYQPANRWDTQTSVGTYTIPGYDAVDLQLLVYSSLRGPDGALTTIGLDSSRVLVTG